MESQRPTPPPSKKTPAVVRGAGALSDRSDGFLAQHGNTILTVILLAAAVVLAARWWTRSAENARAAVIAQLENARANVDQLRSPALAELPPALLMGRVRMIQTTASGILSDVINKAEGPAIKARALVVRGDLDWAVANLPELPGATTQPALRPDPPADDLLRQAGDAYTGALNTTGADKQAIAAARLGLAAVAENRGDWAAARQQLQSVADDVGGVAVLSQAARAQLAELPTLQQPVYVAPPTGVPLPPMSPGAPTTRGVMGPMLPMTGPSTRPLSATRPSK